jgi:hypothetical protein
MPADVRLRAVLDLLREEAELSGSEPVHVRAYVGWLLGLPALAQAATDAKEAVGAARTHRHVAALGFAVADAEDDATRAALVEGLVWLGGREYFKPNQAYGLEGDGLALFGLALGVISLPPGTERDRLAGFLSALVDRAHAVATGDVWTQGLMGAAQVVLLKAGLHGSVAPTVPVDLGAALAAKGGLTLSESEEEEAWNRILALGRRGFGEDVAATQLAALHWLVRAAPTARPGRVTVPDVLNLLEGIKRSLRLWTWEDAPRTRGAQQVRWEINNEYHVQNLLWMVLAPWFPDLEDEENLPSRGPKKPRADLAIPSLRLIVEVKFIHKGNRAKFSAMVGQVSEDTGIYLSPPSSYDGIIAFVWDDTAHSEMHAELAQGLNALNGVVGAVVVARPGKMAESRPDVSPATIAGRAPTTGNAGENKSA